MKKPIYRIIKQTKYSNHITYYIEMYKKFLFWKWWSRNLDFNIFTYGIPIDFKFYDSYDEALNKFESLTEDTKTEVIIQSNDYDMEQLQKEKDLKRRRNHYPFG